MKAIIAGLSAELENYARAARTAHSEATDEQSKAENQYDTRGLEASYLARGQSLQAKEVVLALEQYQALPLREFSKGECIGLGALVEVKGGEGAATYFIGPRAGGLEVRCAGVAVVVLTPQSPLGQQLMGKCVGDRLERGSGRIAAVQ